MALIEVRNLEKVYADEGTATPALRGVSFEIKKGEFVAIMGLFGSGKSTLLHVLGFLDHPTGGTYRFDGKLADQYTDEEAASIRNQKMGFVFQSFNLLSRSTVYQNVELPLLYSNVPQSEWRSRVETAIESVGIKERMHYDTTQLSGGERQRVAIARALVVNPEIIFADEPTGNLDSKSGQNVMEILRDLNEKKGHTILLITHETYTAEQAARIIRIHDGEIASDEKVTNRRAYGDFVK